MKIKNRDAKEKLIQRLRRIEGQVRGVQNMVDEERDCREILQQLTAVRSAVQGASRVFLQEYASACLLDMESPKVGEEMAEAQRRKEQLVRDMIDLLDKAP